MKTIYGGCPILKFNVVKWSIGFLSFITPLILSVFEDNKTWKIILTIMIVLLPILAELFFRIMKSCYLKRKIKFLILNKEYKVEAVGMYILPNFRTSPDELNEKVQSSEKYLINLKFIFNFWTANLKLVGSTSIAGKISSSFYSTNVNVYFESDNSIKVRYVYENEHTIVPTHKTKFISNFTGICNLHFNNQGTLIDYYYSSDGKNRFSFVKQWENYINNAGQRLKELD